MKKYITQNGIKYELRGEQYYPGLGFLCHSINLANIYANRKADDRKNHQLWVMGHTVGILRYLCVTNHLVPIVFKEINLA